MNVIFLSPHFPPQFHLFCRALKGEGVTVLGLGDAPYEALAFELRDVLTAWHYVPDMNRYDDVLRGVAALIARHGRIDRVESLNEHWLDLESRLREDFNIPGPRPAETARHRSKTGMRELFRAAGVPCTDGERLMSHDHAWALASKFGYPLVFKPDVGVGAARTYRVDDEKGMAALLRHPLEGYVVEKFETGPLTSFDGITARDGSIVFAVSHRFSSGIMDIVNSRLTMHYYTRRDIPQLLEELGRKAVAAFGLRERFFHIEFFETPGGGYRALEINLRPPGGFTTDLMNFSSDVDVYRLWAQVLTGQDLSGFEYERKYFCAHVGRRHGVGYARSHDDVIAMLGDRLLFQGPMPPILAGAMGDTFYIFRDPDEDSLQEAIAAIEESA